MYPCRFNRTLHDEPWTSGSTDVTCSARALSPRTPLTLLADGCPASVADCRASPFRLREPSHVHCYRLHLTSDPITAESYRSATSIYSRRRSCFGPINGGAAEYCPRVQRNINAAVYAHSGAIKPSTTPLRDTIRRHRKPESPKAQSLRLR